MKINRPVELSTKGQTLASLSPVISCAKILPLRLLTVSEWQKDQRTVLEALYGLFQANPLVVRSSCIKEDSAKSSMAGHYVSILDVNGKDALRNAIESVVESYAENVSDQDEVLVQPMLENVSMSGVVFSCDPATASPYRIINYTRGGDTTIVTSGLNHPHTFVAAIGAVNIPPDMKPILSMVDELQSFFPDDALDIEFAFAAPNDTLYLLQVRRLLIKQEITDIKQHHVLLKRVTEKITTAQQPHPFLHGRSTVFGVMPDWNPAEIIGIRPRPLALSLYRDLVTDAIWAYQRHNYGYRNLRSFPLLIHFFGQPYIDVRVSFNSFIPKDVESGLAGRLVDYYIDRLIAAPTLHDKVEFEIVFSCYTLDLPTRLKVLAQSGFNDNDQIQLSESLRQLTNRVIDPKNGLWKADEAKLSVLTERREQILSSDLDSIGRIYWLLEDCKRYGTLPFAGLARAGFIAVQMLKSLVAVGVLSQEDYDRFMNGLNTVSRQLARDVISLDRTGFLTRYGHLRPGTYDILSRRYDEAPDTYLSSQRKHSDIHVNRKPFNLSLEQMRTTAGLLKAHGLSSDVVGLFEFLQSAIELREYSKFIFTRNLSDAISMFREWGAQFELSEEELSYANINCIRELYAGSDSPESVLARSIEEGKSRYRETCQIWLPPLITRPDDIWAFKVPESEPNFITQANVTGPVTRPEAKDKLVGAIVCIPSADPGFDWIFSYPIAGLITAYGGVNSHMAIRANELGLPAVIGAGEALFNRWSQAYRLHIDCACRHVEILS